MSTNNDTSPIIQRVASMVMDRIETMQNQDIFDGRKQSTLRDYLLWALEECETNDGLHMEIKEEEVVGPNIGECNTEGGKYHCSMLHHKHTRRACDFHPGNSVIDGQCDFDGSGCCVTGPYAGTKGKKHTVVNYTNKEERVQFDTLEAAQKFADETNGNIEARDKSSGCCMPGCLSDVYKDGYCKTHYQA